MRLASPFRQFLKDLRKDESFKSLELIETYGEKEVFVPLNEGERNIKIKIFKRVPMYVKYYNLIAGIREYNFSE